MVYLIKDGQIVTQNNVPIWLPDGDVSKIEECCCEPAETVPCTEQAPGYWRIATRTKTVNGNIVEIPDVRYYALCRPKQAEFNGFVVFQYEQDENGAWKNLGSLDEPADYIRPASTEDYSCKICKTTPNLSVSLSPFAGTWEDIVRAAVGGSFGNDCSEPVYELRNDRFITYWSLGTYSGVASWIAGPYTEQYDSRPEYVLPTYVFLNGYNARSGNPVYRESPVTPGITHRSVVTQEASFNSTRVGACCEGVNYFGNTATVSFLYSDTYCEGVPFNNGCTANDNYPLRNYSSSHANYLPDTPSSVAGDARWPILLDRTSPWDLRIVFRLEKVQ